MFIEGACGLQVNFVVCWLVVELALREHRDLIQQVCIPVGCIPTVAVADTRFQYWGAGQSDPLETDADPPGGTE